MLKKRKSNETGFGQAEFLGQLGNGKRQKLLQ
jgi:hypothetical protein